MQSSFETVLDFTKSVEGGYVDSPDDPGGATMMGITLATYRDFENDQNLTADDLKVISDQTVSDIYTKFYWLPILGPTLPAGVDLSCSDMAYNAGVHESAILLQRALGVTEDGDIGPETLGAMSKDDATTLINKLATVQLAFYESLPTFGTFGDGWTNRVNARQQAALALVQTVTPTVPKPSTNVLGWLKGLFR